MIRSWRIVDALHAAHAFDGEGPRFLGGRWNSPGVRVVYTSENAALAALEVLVHLKRMRSLPDFAVISCQFDEKLVEAVKDLPEGWRDYPPRPEQQAIGDEWARSARSAVLRVPSVIVPGENNYLLNPAHPKFKKIAIGKPERFELDLRLTK
ncbi:MAG TPA: RES family NAD+ phosphorylase [Thermoanaerobaculia bacterium]|nr:RES family NAD+ phosphorylase [Thermoanaerobaculia bacterium]